MTHLSVDFYHSREASKDRPEAEQLTRPALLRKTEFEADFRIVLPDGTIKTSRSKGIRTWDEAATSLEFVRGLKYNVTEHHRARADLESIEEMKRLKRQLQNENVCSGSRSTKRFNGRRGSSAPRWRLQGVFSGNESCSHRFERSG